MEPALQVRSIEVLRKVYGQTINQGGTADMILFVLDRAFLSRIFLFVLFNRAIVVKMLAIRLVLVYNYEV